MVGVSNGPLLFIAHTHHLIICKHFLTFLASSASQIANKWYNAHSTHWILFFWFCCASFVENVRDVIPGQSSCRSKSRSRRLVRKMEILLGPAIVVVEGGGAFSVDAETRRLRDRASSGLMPVTDIVQNQSQVSSL